MFGQPYFDYLKHSLGFELVCFRSKYIFFPIRGSFLLLQYDIRVGELTFPLQKPGIFIASLKSFHRKFFMQCRHGFSSVKLAAL